MTFEVISKHGKTTGSVSNCIEYMGELGVMQAIEVNETGLGFAMMVLNKGQSLTLDGKENEEFKVTRIG